MPMSLFSLVFAQERLECVNREGVPVPCRDGAVPISELTILFQNLLNLDELFVKL